MAITTSAEPHYSPSRQMGPKNDGSSLVRVCRSWSPIASPMWSCIEDISALIPYKWCPIDSIFSDLLHAIGVQCLRDANQCLLALGLFQRLQTCGTPKSNQKMPLIVSEPLGCGHQHVADVQSFSYLRKVRPQCNSSMKIQDQTMKEYRLYPNRLSMPRRQLMSLQPTTPCPKPRKSIRGKERRC